MTQRTKYLITQKQILFCFLIITLFFFGCQTANSDLQKETAAETHFSETELSISAEQLTKLGAKYSEERNNLTALDYFNKAIQADPAYALAYTHRGMLYVRTKKYTEAIKDFEEAIQLTPDPDRSSAMDIIPYLLHGACNYELGNYEQAIESLSKVIEMNSYYSDAYNYQGMAYFHLKKYQEAIEKYTLAIHVAGIAKVVPQDTYYLNRAQAYVAIREYMKSVDDYTEYLKINPNNVFVHIERGSSYNFLEQYDEALSDYLQALKLEPDLILAHLACGMVYYNMGRYEESIDAFSQVLRSDSIFMIYAYGGRGMAYMFLHKYEMAVNDFTQGLRLNPMEAKTYKNRGIAYLNWGKYREAVNDFNESMRLDTNDSETYQLWEEANKRLNSGSMGDYEFVMPPLKLNT